MKKNKVFILLLFFFLFPSLDNLYANEYHFETSSNEIINKLTEKGKIQSAITRSISINKKSIKPSIGIVNLKLEFKHDSAVLRKSSIKTLNNLGVALMDEKLRGKNILISGYTDSDGQLSYNLKLSEKRALVVKSFIVKNYNIDARKIKTKGFGESKPLSSNDSSMGKQRNRRVEVRLLSQ